MRISSIFNSIDGEVNWWGQGSLTTFIRFAGCNLRCKYCDTKWAQEELGGREYTQMDLINAVVNMGYSKVTITGGEPLVQQEDVGVVVAGLLRRGIEKISIETNGSIIPEIRSPKISWVVDYKLPSSGMMGKMMQMDWFSIFGYRDFIKMVILTEEDYGVARTLARHFRRATPARIAFSLGMTKDGSFPVIPPQELIGRLQQDRLTDCIVNIQLHKLIGLVEDSDSGKKTPLKKEVKKKAKK